MAGLGEFTKLLFLSKLRFFVEASFFRYFFAKHTFTSSLITIPVVTGACPTAPKMPAPLQLEISGLGLELCRVVLCLVLSCLVLSRLILSCLVFLSCLSFLVFPRLKPRLSVFYPQSVSAESLSLKATTPTPQAPIKVSSLHDVAFPHLLNKNDFPNHGWPEIHEDHFRNRMWLLWMWLHRMWLHRMWLNHVILP